MKHYESVEFLLIFKMLSHPAQMQNPPIETFLVTVLPKHWRQRQTINESVCCFEWSMTWFTALRGNKLNRTLAEQWNGENSSKTFPC